MAQKQEVVACRVVIWPKHSSLEESLFSFLLVEKATLLYRTMANRVYLLNKVREVLSQKLFKERQIERILPRLHGKILENPEHLSEIVDTWNILLGSSGMRLQHEDSRRIPSVASPSSKTSIGDTKINMNTILSEIEPDLLLLDPEKLVSRHNRVKGLGIAKTLKEEWLLLYNAPRGFYLQDWIDLSKKIYYIEHKLIDFLFDKREQKSMEVHPILRCAVVSELEFDHIRTRYLFALRSGYAALSHMYSVQMALDRPGLRELLLTDNQAYLKKFAPFCSEDEYNAFSGLIKNTSIDEDDAEIFERLADLNALRY